MTGRPKRHILLLFLVLVLPACGLTVTNDRPDYEELEEPGKEAVDIIYSELQALEAEVRSHTRAMYQTSIDLDPVVDRSNIDVSFTGMVLAFNVGDGQVHIAMWENLTNRQRAAVQRALKATPDVAAELFRKLFYRVLAVAQGVKQYMYNVGSVERAYSKFSVFNMELHPMRTAMAYFADVDRKSDIWSFTAKACDSVLEQNDGRWGHMFTTGEADASPRFPLAKAYIRENHDQFISGADPTVNLYFVCQWIRISREESQSLDTELGWLHQKLR